jgi:hypothetical protein
MFWTPHQSSWDVGNLILCNSVIFFKVKPIMPFTMW